MLNIELSEAILLIVMSAIGVSSALLLLKSVSVLFDLMEARPLDWRVAAISVGMCLVALAGLAGTLRYFVD